jgi:hypothetical protein
MLSNNVEKGCISAGTFASLMAPSRPLVHGVDVYKDKEKNSPPVALERSEYPLWVSSLTPGGLPSLTKLKRMNVEDATDREKKEILEADLTSQDSITKCRCR